MKQALLLLTTVLVFGQVNAQVHTDSTYALKNPADVLQNNECVFRNKSNELKDYDAVVFACDRRYTSAFLLQSDNLKPGMCVYDLFSKMTGYKLARVVKPCPTRAENHLPNTYGEETPLEQLKAEAEAAAAAEKAQAEEQGVEKPAKPQAPAPANKPQDQAMADIKGEAKPAAKPKKEKVVEVTPGEFVVAPDELDF